MNVVFSPVSREGDVHRNRPSSPGLHEHTRRAANITHGNRRGRRACARLDRPLRGRKLFRIATVSVVLGGGGPPAPASALRPFPCLLPCHFCPRVRHVRGTLQPASCHGRGRRAKAQNSALIPARGPNDGGAGSGAGYPGRLTRGRTRTRLRFVERPDFPGLKRDAASP